VFQYAGGTRASSCFISVTLKSWLGRNLLDPTSYVFSETVSTLIFLFNPIALLQRCRNIPTRVDSSFLICPPKKR
jgi:hypothetical protein